MSSTNFKVGSLYRRTDANSYRGAFSQVGHLYRIVEVKNNIPCVYFDYFDPENPEASRTSFSAYPPTKGGKKWAFSLTANPLPGDFVRITRDRPLTPLVARIMKINDKKGIFTYQGTDGGTWSASLVSSYEQLSHAEGARAFHEASAPLPRVPFAPHRREQFTLYEPLQGLADQVHNHKYFLQKLESQIYDADRKLRDHENELLDKLDETAPITLPEYEELVSELKATKMLVDHHRTFGNASRKEANDLRSRLRDAELFGRNNVRSLKERYYKSFIIYVGASFLALSTLGITNYQLHSNPLSLTYHDEGEILTHIYREAAARDLQVLTLDEYAKLSGLEVSD